MLTRLFCTVATDAETRALKDRRRRRRRVNGLFGQAHMTAGRPRSCCCASPPDATRCSSPPPLPKWPLSARGRGPPSLASSSRSAPAPSAQSWCRSPSIVPSAVDRGQLVTAAREMIASRCRSDLAPDCTTSPPFGVNGSRKNGFVVTVSTRALNGGRGASVAACAAVAWGCARSHCSCRAPIGQLQRLCRALPTARLGS